MRTNYCSDNMGKSYKHNFEIRKSYTNEYILYSTYVKLEKTSKT